MPARPHARGSARHFVGLPPEEVAVTYTPFPIHQRLKNGPGTRLCSVSALAKVILTRSARAAGLWLPPLRTRCLPAAMPAAVSASQLAVVYKAREKKRTHIAIRKKKHHHTNRVHRLHFLIPSLHTSYRVSLYPDSTGDLTCAHNCPHRIAVISADMRGSPVQSSQVI